MKLVTRNYEFIEGSWVLVSSDSEEYTVEKWYELIVSKETLKFFRNLGGKETVQGFKCTSVSPDKAKKTIRVLK